MDNQPEKEVKGTKDFPGKDYLGIIAVLGVVIIFFAALLIISNQGNDSNSNTNTNTNTVNQAPEEINTLPTDNRSYFIGINKNKYFGQEFIIAVPSNEDGEYQTDINNEQLIFTSKRGSQVLISRQLYDPSNSLNYLKGIYPNSKKFSFAGYPGLLYKQQTSNGTFIIASGLIESWLYQIQITSDNQSAAEADLNQLLNSFKVRSNAS
jgi:hypothetical protein